MTSTLTIPAQLVTDENNIRVAEVAIGRSCAGCHKAGCQAKAHRFPVDTSLSEGPVGVDINALDFGLLLANSLGLPLMGLLLGAGLGRFWGGAGRAAVGARYRWSGRWYSELSRLFAIIDPYS